MDQNMLGAWLLMYIENNFPGGAAEFTHSGGVVLGLNDGTVIIYHPEMPTSFAQDISSKLEGIDLIVTSSASDAVKETLERLSQIHNSSTPIPAMKSKRHVINDADITSMKKVMEMGVDEFINKM
jgi:hypothetical protein